MKDQQTHTSYSFNFGHKHFVVQRRYEVIGAINDCMIAIWFLIGSLFFLNNSLIESGTWLFIVGSAQLLIKPAVKIASLIHVNAICTKCPPQTANSNEQQSSKLS